MTLLTNDPLTQLAFAIHENPGVFAVLIGSGLSRSAEIPTGWEITLDLIRRTAIAQGAEDQADWVQWYRNKTGQEPNYSVLLEDIASAPDERRAIIHRYIEPTAEDRDEGRKIPTPAHHAIARLVRSGKVKVIITTNFDRLMENALREQGVEPTVVYSEDMLSGAEPITHTSCYLLKLHGDYKDARILNTDTELSAYPAGFDRLLDRIFDEHGLVICGWSGEWDHALRAAMLRAPNRRYPFYWAAKDRLGAGAQEIVAHRQARSLIIQGADVFFSTLQQRVEILDQSQLQNPRSVALLISSTKRYLAKPEYRIQLDDLVSQECEHLTAELNEDSFPTRGPWNQDVYLKRVQQYEDLAEPLAKMAGVMGRWGDGSDLPLVLDLLETLYKKAEGVRNGLNVYLDIRSYPVVLVFTAYGLGLTRSQRWATLHALFCALWATDRRDPQRLVSLLFLQGWKGDNKDMWQLLEGLENRKTPLSDHLLEIMTAWGPSFTGVSTDIEYTFEKFEALGSLAYFEQNDESSLEQALQSSNHQIFAQMPMGRLGWHESSFSRITHELQNPAITGPLLSGGFANGNSRLLEIFIINFERYHSRMAW